MTSPAQDPDRGWRKISAALAKRRIAGAPALVQNEPTWKT